MMSFSMACLNSKVLTLLIALAIFGPNVFILASTEPAVDPTVTNMTTEMTTLENSTNGCVMNVTNTTSVNGTAQSDMTNSTYGCVMNETETTTPIDDSTQPEGPTAGDGGGGGTEATTTGSAPTGGGGNGNGGGGNGNGGGGGSDGNSTSGGSMTTGGSDGNSTSGGSMTTGGPGGNTIDDGDMSTGSNGGDNGGGGNMQTDAPDGNTVDGGGMQTDAPGGNTVDGGGMQTGGSGGDNGSGGDMQTDAPGGNTGDGGGMQTDAPGSGDGGDTQSGCGESGSNGDGDTNDTPCCDVPYELNSETNQCSCSCEGCVERDWGCQYLPTSLQLQSGVTFTLTTTNAQGLANALGRGSGQSVLVELITDEVNRYCRQAENTPMCCDVNINAAAEGMTFSGTFAEESDVATVVSVSSSNKVLVYVTVTKSPSEDLCTQYSDFTVARRRRDLLSIRHLLSTVLYLPQSALQPLTSSAAFMGNMTTVLVTETNIQFSIVVDVTVTPESNAGENVGEEESEGSPGWVIPVAVILALLGVAIIVIVIVLVVKKSGKVEDNP